MNARHLMIAVATAALASGCGQEQPAPAKPAAPAATSAPAQPAAAPEAKKKEEGAQVPETHGMPGMAELFKGEEKGEKK